MGRALSRTLERRALERIASALERIADSFEQDREVLDRVADGLEQASSALDLQDTRSDYPRKGRG